MPDAVWLLAALACAALGMGWLALAMDVHWAQVCESRTRSRGTVITLRLLGGSALAASLLLCLAADTATMAVLVWMMLLAVGAFSTAWILSWRPQSLALLAAPLR